MRQQVLLLVCCVIACAVVPEIFAQTTEEPVDPDKVVIPTLCAPITPHQPGSCS